MKADALAGRARVSDEEATAALQEFFSALSPSEACRIYECFYYQCHKEFPPPAPHYVPQPSGSKVDGGGGAKFKEVGI